MAQEMPRERRQAKGNSMTNDQEKQMRLVVLVGGAMHGKWMPILDPDVTSIIGPDRGELGREIYAQSADGPDIWEVQK
jgi:hypothetical protein